MSVSERSDPGRVIAELEERARRAGVSPDGLSALRSQAEDVVRRLVERAQDIARLGSQMTVERRIDGVEYQVTVECVVGKRRSRIGNWLSRIGIR